MTLILHPSSHALVCHLESQFPPLSKGDKSHSVGMQCGLSNIWKVPVQVFTHHGCSINVGITSKRSLGGGLSPAS